MAWRDEMRPGRFRDAPFQVEGHEASSGRRVAVHEYPLRDAPYPEDLGRATRKWSVTAYVLGADYMRARDLLIEALEAGGPGTLVHPWLGTLRVAVQDFQFNESTREGGLARFSIQFVEAGEPARPDVRLDTRANVAAKADSAQSTAEAGFAEVWDTTGPGWVLAEAEQTAQGALDLITAILGRLQFDSLNAWLDNGLALAGAIAGAVAQARRNIAAPARRIAALRGLFDYGTGVSYATPTVTPARARVRSNRAVVATLVRQSAVIEAALASSQVEFASHDEAVATRDELAEQLDTLTLTADDTTYQALVDLRTAVVADISERGANLARLVRVTPAATLPALVLAHRYYGDAERESEILTRNHVRHPGAVPGGQPLEVTTDAA